MGLKPPPFVLTLVWIVLLYGSAVSAIVLSLALRLFMQCVF